MPIPLDCEFIFAVSGNGDGSYELIEFYTIKGESFTFRYGKYTADLGLRTAEQSFMERRSNLRNVSFDFAEEQWDADVSSN